MKYWYLLASGLIVIGIMMVWTGCGEGNGGTATGSVTATALDAAGNALPGVTVTIGTHSGVTDSQGKVTLSGLSSEASAVVDFQLVNYCLSHAVTTIVAGLTTNVSAGMQPVSNTVTVAGLLSSNKNVTDIRADNHNATVTLPTNSVLNDSNQPVDSAQVSITTALPSDSRYLDNFPGMLIGLPTGGTSSVPIESFGYVDVSLGAGLHLDSSKPATITIPIDPLHDPLDATIPLWSLNNTTGVWEQTGIATRDVTNSFYSATVTHFSPYNLDRPILNSGPLEITAVEQGTTTPVAGAKITVSTYDATTNGLWRATVYTAANGKVTIQVPQSGNPQILGDANGRPGIPGAIANGKVTVSFISASSLSPITAVVKDGSGNLVSGALVTANSEGGVGTGFYQFGSGYTDASGQIVFNNAPTTGLVFVKAEKNGKTGNGNWTSGSRTITITIQ